MAANIFQTKSIEQLTGDIEKGKGLKRSLTALDLTLLGIGAIIGTGIFVLTGTAAANQAGPAITLSYVWPASPAVSRPCATPSSPP
jgi:APA family basic amino acid/polyamine antiporter